MKFTKYSSIKNVSKNELLERAQKLDTDWIVTEKIYGANLSIWYNGDSNNYEVASRIKVLDENDEFHNYRKAITYRFFVQLRKLYHHLKYNEGMDIETVVIYGELFGGYWPKDIQANIEHDPEPQIITDGIYYSPNVHFIGFDIGVVIDGEFMLLPYDKAYELANKSFIDYSEILFRGSLEECMNYDCAFSSTIPKRVAGVHLDNNICEGVVISPTTPYYTNGGERFIFKNKTDKYKENGQHYRPRPIAKNAEWTDDMNNVYDELSQYANKPRIQSAISKIGTLTQKTFGPTIGMSIRDLLADFESDNPNGAYQIYENLDKGSQKLVRKKLTSRVTEMVNKIMNNWT